MNTSPNSSGPIVITEVPNHFLVRIPSDLGQRARKIPGRQWDGNRKMWVFPKSISTYQALEAEFKAGADVFAIRRPADSACVQKTPTTEDSNYASTDAPKTEEEFEEQLTMVVQQEPERDQDFESLHRLLLGVHEGMTEQRRTLETVLQKNEELSERLAELNTTPQAKSKEIQVVKELPEFLDLSQTTDLKLLEKSLIGVAFVTCGRDQAFMNWVLRQKPLLAPFDFVCKTHEYLKQQLEKISGYGGPETNFWDLVKHINAEGLIYCEKFDPVQVFPILGTMNALRNQFTHQRAEIGEAERMSRSILYLMNLALIWRRVMVDEEE